MTKNKKAIATISIIMSIIFAIIGIYLILFIPLPAFTRIRMTFNYFLILIFFIVIQIGLIYAYYKLGKYAMRGFNIIKTKLMNWSINIRNYIVIHS
jgi:hypothetical protein